MNARSTFAAAAISAVLLAGTAACKSSTSGSGSTGGGGTSGGSDGSSGGDPGSVAAAGGEDSLGDTFPASILDGVSQAASSTDSRGEFGTEYNNLAEIGTCKFYFGINPARSNEYIVSADSDGIGGQMAWSCNKVNSGGDIRIDEINLWLEWSHAPTAGGPWTKEPDGTGNRTITDPGGSGALIVFNDHCTTDYWRAVFKVEVEQANQGMVTQTVHSQWRKVTPDDCSRG